MRLLVKARALVTIRTKFIDLWLVQTWAAARAWRSSLFARLYGYSTFFIHCTYDGYLEDKTDRWAPTHARGSAPRSYRHSHFSIYPISPVKKRGSWSWRNSVIRRLSTGSALPTNLLFCRQLEVRTTEEDEKAPAVESN